ncbi:hypothetical protein DJ527_13155, partial [Sulfolobus sp. F1]
MLSYNGNVRENYKTLALSVALIVIFVNPVMEVLQGINPIIYMLDHYALYLAGLIFGSKFFKGSIHTLILGVIPAIFWHYPLFFDLAGASITFRLLCEATLFLGGLLAGSFIPVASLRSKVILFALYMLGDTLLSIFFILGYPQYSNVYFPSLAWGPSALFGVGI